MLPTESVTWVSVCIVACLGVLYVNCEENVTTQNPLGDWTPPATWRQGDIPDPQVDVWKCGRGGKKSHVCNPDHVLTDEQADDLDKQLRGLKNIPGGCQCKKQTCFAKPSHKGFHATLVVVKSMKIPKHASREKKIKEVRENSCYILNHVYKHGLCKDDLLILLLTDDRLVYTATGDLTKTVLADHCVDDIYKENKPYLANSAFTTALRNMINSYRLILAKEQKCVENTGFILKVVALTVGCIIAVVGIGYCVKKYCCKKSSSRKSPAMTYHAEPASKPRPVESSLQSNITPLTTKPATIAPPVRTSAPRSTTSYSSANRPSRSTRRSSPRRYSPVRRSSPCRSSPCRGSSPGGHSCGGGGGDW